MFSHHSTRHQHCPRKVLTITSLHQPATNLNCAYTYKSRSFWRSISQALTDQGFQSFCFTICSTINPSKNLFLVKKTCNCTAVSQHRDEHECFCQPFFFLPYSPCAYFHPLIGIYILSSKRKQPAASNQSKEITCGLKAITRELSSLQSLSHSAHILLPRLTISRQAGLHFGCFLFRRQTWIQRCPCLPDPHPLPHSCQVVPPGPSQSRASGRRWRSWWRRCVCGWLAWPTALAPGTHRERSVLSVKKHTHTHTHLAHKT
jgi:hypothetical protein